MKKTVIAAFVVALGFVPLGMLAQTTTGQASSIYGKYHLKWSSVCISAPELSGGVSPFTQSGTSTNLPKITMATPSAASNFHESYEADVVVNPKLNTITTNLKKVLALNNGVDSNGLIWHRDNRTSSQTFTIDTASDTLVYTGSTESWTTWWGANATVTNGGGSRWRTLDSGQTIEGAMIDVPVISRVTFSDGTPSRRSMCISTSFKGTRLSKTY